MKPPITQLNFLDLDGVLLNILMAQELQKVSRSLLVNQIYETYPEKKNRENRDLGPEATNGDESFTASLLKKLDLPPDWAIKNCADNYPLLRLNMQQVIKRNQVLDLKLQRLTDDCHHRNIIVSHNTYEFVRDTIDLLGVGHRFGRPDIIVLSDMGMMGKNTREGQKFLDDRFEAAYPRAKVRRNYLDDQMRNLEIPFEIRGNCCRFVHPNTPPANAPCHFHHSKAEDALDAMAEAA